MVESYSGWGKNRRQSWMEEGEWVGEVGVGVGGMTEMGKIKRIKGNAYLQNII